MDATFWADLLVIPVCRNASSPLVDSALESSPPSAALSSPLLTLLQWAAGCVVKMMRIFFRAFGRTVYWSERPWKIFSLLLSERDQQTFKWIEH